MIAWCVAVAVSIYTNHYTPIWWITAECDTPRTGLLLAEHSQPEWDGIHGRWISLLPRQNQFTPLDNHFPLLELLPPKLVKESIDVDRHTKVLVGVASDHTPAKVVHGGKLIRAGEPVYLRIVPDSEKKTYNLTVVDGTAVSHEHVLFSEEWASPRDHRQKQISYNARSANYDSALISSTPYSSHAGNKTGKSGSCISCYTCAATT